MSNSNTAIWSLAFTMGWIVAMYFIPFHVRRWRDKTDYPIMNPRDWVVGAVVALAWPIILVAYLVLALWRNRW